MPHPLLKRIYKRLSPFLPLFVQNYFENGRMLTMVSRELIFSSEFNTRDKRRREARRLLQYYSSRLGQAYPAVLKSVYVAGCLPLTADVAYRQKLTLESVVNDGKPQSDRGQKNLTVSIILYADHFHEKGWKDSVESVIRQRSSAWELWLVSEDDSVSAEPGDPDIPSSEQIRSVGSIEQALASCNGQVIHKLSAGDTLHANAATEVLGVMSRQCADVVYTDHDYLGKNGERIKPRFKPDWNPDLHASCDYIGPAVFYRKECSGKVKVAHIPQVLCHCAEPVSFKPDQEAATPVGDEVVLELLAPVSTSRVSYERGEGLIPGSQRRKYVLPDKPPLVSLLIPTRDRLDILQPCITSILEKTTYPNVEIIILDNQSEQPETLDWFEKAQQNSRVQVVAYDHLFNYSAMNNWGVSRSGGSVIGLINNDVEVINPGWLNEMVSQALRPEIGCVGAKLYYGDGRIQHAGVILGAGGGTAHGHRYFEYDADGYCGRLKLVQNVSAVTGACLVVQRELYEQVGGLEEEGLQIAWSDIDLCLKVREAGYRNLWTPYAELFHHESVSRGRDASSEQRKRYQAEKAWMVQRWGSDLWRDPYYNPNLTAAREDFSLNMLHGL